MWRLWIVLPLLVLMGCQKNEGALRLTVKYSGFKPGCVRVIASDSSGVGEPSATEVEGKGAATGGSLTMAVFRSEGWGSTLKVEAQAFERACPSTGEAVTHRSDTVTLTPGKVGELSLELGAQDVDADGFASEASGGSDCDDSDPGRHPEAPELCDTKDNDCDGQTNEGLGLGDSCTQPGNCTGLRACALDGGVACNTPQPTLTRFRDGDNDGFGARDAGAELFCNPPSSGYSTVNTDCDDGTSARNPLASERCDGVDDDCDDQPDDGLGLGSSCAPDGGCTGSIACNGAGGTRCEPLTFPSLYYPDEDRDSHGRADAGAVPLCGAVPPAGFASSSDDCDDGDLFTFPSARELCDLKDNDCDGLNEGTGVCPPGGPTWVSSTVGVNNRSWRSVSLWGDGGVWIVGVSDRRAVKLPSDTSFSVMTTGCTGSWHSLWVGPGGRAFYGGLNGELAIQDAIAGACTKPVVSSNTNINGLMGLPGPSGTEFFGGGEDTANATLGKTFSWDGGTQLQQGTAAVAPLYDVHGLSREILFASGGTTTSPRLYRFNPATQDWQTENVENTTTATGLIEGIWVVNDRLAYAVGGNGSVLRWNGTAWSSVAFPGTDDLSAVVAFGRNSVYATSHSGKIFRYDGSTWQTVANPGVELYDIAANSPEDIWAVGLSGTVIHWPR